MTALALAPPPRTLDDVLRAALGPRPAPQTPRSERGRGAAADVRCVVCHGAAERRSDGQGGLVTSCPGCGSTLEEPFDVPLPCAHAA